jgi:demethylmenaquinone methyltransferase/2-methoxy-6-polyprenyl-1,4-benzoquinol methylase
MKGSLLKTSYQKTLFGFKEVSDHEKDRLVQSLFSRVATRYDLMNDLMSGGLHRLWKNKLIRTLNPSPNMHLLDVAGGTGDVAFRFLDKTKAMTPQPSVTVFDRNPQMLLVGRDREIDQGILTSLHWCCGTAESLPYQNASFDAYTIAFGLRNVTRIEIALREAYRVLKPGGKFLCLEFSKVSIPFLNALYRKYSFHIIPTLGAWIANDRNAYKYLVESIERFPNQQKLMTLLQKAGFNLVKHQNLSAGIVAIHLGIKR